LLVDEHLIAEGQVALLLITSQLLVSVLLGNTILAQSLEELILHRQ
jgi:hypothetical protein